MSKLRLTEETQTYRIEGSGAEVGEALDAFIPPPGWRLDGIGIDTEVERFGSIANPDMRLSVVHHGVVTVSRGHA